MYPIIRMIKEFAVNRNAPALPWNGVHVSHHVCWPWDLDIWLELNNGRSLTLYDLGRIPFAGRVGLIAAMKREKWALTMAGASVRWRARVKVFERVEIHSRCVGWDNRFIYLVQEMWKGDGTCASQILYRSAATDKKGIVSPQRVMAAMGLEIDRPNLPEWVTAWINAEATRPWPPENQITG